MEVMKLEFSATSDSMHVELDAVEAYVDAGGVARMRVVVGGPRPPLVHFKMAELADVDPMLAADLRSVILRLEPIARAKALSRASDPKALQDAAHQIALAEKSLAEARADHASKATERADAIKSLDNQHAERVDKLAALDAELAARGAALASDDETVTHTASGEIQHG